MQNLRVFDSFYLIYYQFVHKLNWWLMLFSRNWTIFETFFHGFQDSCKFFGYCIKKKKKSKKVDSNTKNKVNFPFTYLFIVFHFSGLVNYAFYWSRFIKLEELSQSFKDISFWIKVSVKIRFFLFHKLHQILNKVFLKFITHEFKSM